MPLTPRQLVHKIHDTPTRFVLALAGGGSRAAAELLEVPGASRSVLEVVVPYSSGAMAVFLGGTPDQACSASTARAMAMAAFLGALGYGGSEFPLAGIAATAGLATDRPRRGPHRVHLAVQTEPVTAVRSIELQKGGRSRAGEESLVTRLILNLVAETCGLDLRLNIDLREGEQIDESRTIAPPPWRDLLLSKTDVVRHDARHLTVDRELIPSVSPLTPVPSPARGEGRLGTSVEPAGAIFPGAFNPLHDGHRRMMETAQQVLGTAVEPEISILNVDKPPMDYFELQRRTRQFEPERLVWLTRLPTFEAKSRRFPGVTFVVGVDTLRRIADPKYYGDDSAACRAALERIASRGCRFLVFGRLINRWFTQLEHLDLPDVLRSICHPVPAEQFREDVSSTAIRRSAASREA